MLLATHCAVHPPAAGNSISYCSTVVVAGASDTCYTIASAASAIVVNVAGANATTCNTLFPGAPVCVSDAVSTVSSPRLLPPTPFLPPCVASPATHTCP